MAKSGDMSAGGWVSVCFLLLGVCTPILCDSPSNVLGCTGEGYYTEIEIGTPPQKLNVLIDTGSANLAIAAAALPNVDTYFVSNSSCTFHNSEQSVSVAYTLGSWWGHLGNDLVKIPNIGVPSVRCDIALVQTSQNFFMNDSKWQGILGLGYTALAQPRNYISWLGALPDPIAFTLRLGCTHLNSSNTDIWGYLDIQHLPVTSTPFIATVVRDWFYEVVVCGIWVSEDAIDLPCQEFNNDRSIVDSGTTNLRLPPKVFDKIVDKMNKSVRAEGVNVPDEFWTIGDSVCFADVGQLGLFPHLALGLARKDGQCFSVHLGPQSYLRHKEGADSNCYRLAVEPSDSGTVLGIVFLEGMDVTFDQSGHSVHFAEGECGPLVVLQGPFYHEDALDCAHKAMETGNAWTALYAIVGVFLSAMAAIGALVLCSRLCDRCVRLPNGPQGRWPTRSASRRALVPANSDLDLTTAT